MAYTALYRKFRPDTFDGVIGQEHIVKTLQNQMKTGRVSHAYLFCGTRGTGKTSTAKIFSRAMNCLHPDEDGNPCNECILCRDMLEGRSVNVMELDAASNNGVENVREIREEVKYPPAQGKYKVYIIDEVHMLSNSAFNALLKTLEEPPEHVMFILATTDPQKVPQTILSRCQRFDFRRITTEDIAHTLMGYLAEEGRNVTEEAVRHVARLGDGSMRDSLSILDQCLAFYGDELLTLDKIVDLTGAVDQSIFFELTEALGSKNSASVMLIVEKMMQSGRNIKQFVGDYLTHLRNFLLVHTLPDLQGVLDISEEDKNSFVAEKAHLSPQEALYMIERFSRLQSELRYATNERILLEIEVLRICAPWTETDVTALMGRLASLERKVAEGVKVMVQQTPSAEPQKPKAPPKPKVKQKPLDEEKQKLVQQWQLICSECKDPLLKPIIKGAEIAFKDDDVVYLLCEEEVHVQMVEKRLTTVEDLIEREMEKNFAVSVISKKQYDTWKKATYGDANDEVDDDWGGLFDAIPDAEYFDEQ
ncbi:DNA polymerase III subunit gamma/tau [Chakrabartyella piscis]|uniref:DNA polymerase III subunit gamma/tau n=1 Tax=Chakrabartyella piscis TaxID=2918914 RepID=UPI00295843D9|nr:DNA polymerase III subunit gamma/tau [Chakrabartyella piscis]